MVPSPPGAKLVCMLEDMTVDGYEPGLRVSEVAEQLTQQGAYVSAAQVRLAAA